MAAKPLADKEHAMTSEPLQVTFTLPNRTRATERPKAPEPKPRPAIEGSIPRLSRVMALAITFNDLIACGKARDLADLARLGMVTRARITQIMDLTMLAPDIQEEVLHLPRVTKGRPPITERQVRAIAKLLYWPQQREAWKDLL